MAQKTEMEWMTLYTYKSELVFAKIILSNLVIAGNIIDIFEKKKHFILDLNLKQKFKNL